MKPVRLADIARATGYSINTVSHALNDKPDISEKTKEYITKTAREMGYIVNHSASSLRSGRSKSIAIIVGDISNPHFSIMIKEMANRLRDFQYNAIIMNTDEDEELEYAAIVSAISKNVDGILLCPAQKTLNNLRFLESTGIPFLLVGRRFEGIPSHYCICDDINGGFVAAEHLLNLGHRRILFINGPLCISSARERLEGIRRAFAQVSSDWESVPELFLAQVSGIGNDAAIPEILREHSDCTGIICFSDLIAMEVCHFLKKDGKQVPGDVSVIGFDNIASKFYFPLMLTSVTSSKTKMSVQAVESLMAIIEHDENKISADSESSVLPGADSTDPFRSESQAGFCQQHILPTRVVERESTLPPQRQPEK